MLGNKSYSSFKDRVYDEYYSNVPIDSNNDRIFKSVFIRIHSCDICDDVIESCRDDIERRMLILKEIGLAYFPTAIIHSYVPKNNLNNNFLVINNV